MRTNPQKAGVAISTSDKVDCRQKDSPRDKEGHAVIIMQPTYLEDTTLNNYAPNNRVSKKQS